MKLEMLEFDLEGLTQRRLDELVEDGFFDDVSKEDIVEMIAYHVFDYFGGDTDHAELPKNIWEVLAPYASKDEVNEYFKDMRSIMELM